MPIILHITTRQEWDAARDGGSYAAPSLRAQGFIHCSKPEQVVDVANHLFRGRQGLVLLCIETAKVIPEIRYENLVGGSDLFPHIYGELSVAAVVDVLPFEPSPDGTFVILPEIACEGED